MRKKSKAKVYVSITTRMNKISTLLSEIKEISAINNIVGTELLLKEIEVVLVNNVWTEDFVDEDTGEVVSVERKMLMYVNSQKKGILNCL